MSVSVVSVLCMNVHNKVVHIHKFSIISEKKRNVYLIYSI